MLPEEIHGPEEVAALKFLGELQGLLAQAIDSLGGKQVAGGGPQYVAWAATSVNRAAGGYLFLRESGRTDASKFLVRPVVESVIKVTAVLRKPEFFFRLAYDELMKEKKIRSMAGGAALWEKDKKEIERAFRQQYPTKTLDENLRISDVAKAARMRKFYDVTYGIYCKFTHGALIAVTGELNAATDMCDTVLVSWSALAMLRALQLTTPATVPDLTSHTKRIRQDFVRLGIPGVDAFPLGAAVP